MEMPELTLQAEGDRHERRMWPLVRDRFPSYERFWRAFIVPLSHRTNPDLTKDDPKWYRIRSGVPRHFERLAMAHYSVFYWVGRGLEKLEKTEDSYPEDVLFLFDSALDCLDIFIADVRKVAKDTGQKLKSIPSGTVSKSAPAFRTVRAYRNTILHSPVLGRRIALDGTFIVKEDHLRYAKESWMHAASLPADAFVRVATLLSEVADAFLAALEQIWSRLTSELLGSPAFNQKVQRVVAAAAKEEGSEESTHAASSANSLSASGAFFLVPHDVPSKS